MPPITPGMTIRRNSRQFTFLCSVWLIPEAPVVKTSTAWTLAEAAAGGTPRLISKVLEITPNAMPSAPSTSWAANPTRMKGSSSAKVAASRCKRGAPGGSAGALPAAHSDAPAGCKCRLADRDAPQVRNS